MPIINPYSLPADNSPEPQGGNTGSLLEITSTNTAFQLLAANPSRKGYYLKNTSPNTTLFVMLSADGDPVRASIQLVPNAVYEDLEGAYTGVVRGYMDGGVAGQKVLVNELTYSA